MSSKEFTIYFIGKKIVALNYTPSMMVQNFFPTRPRKVVTFVGNFYHVGSLWTKDFPQTHTLHFHMILYQYYIIYKLSEGLDLKNIIYIYLYKISFSIQINHVLLYLVENS